MAIQKIEVIDNNKVNDCDLLSVHNPLVYVIKMTVDDSGASIDDVIEVDVNISGNDTESLGTFYATFLRQDNPNDRIYIFNADEVLRSGLNEYNDYEQDFNSKTNPEDDKIDLYIAKGAYLTFRADASGTPIEIIESLTAVNAARDFEYENGACLTDLCADIPQVYVGAENKEVYTYDYFGNELNWWSSEITGDVQVDGTIIYANDPPFTTNWLARGQYLITNEVDNSEVLSVIIMRNTPQYEFEVQIGANTNESHNNIIEHLKQFEPTIQNIQIKKPAGESNYSIFFTDATDWFLFSGFASLVVQLDNISAGDNFHFDYTTPDGLTTTQVRLQVVASAVLPTDIEINPDYDILIQNIKDAIILNYPNLEPLVAYNGDFFDKVPVGVPANPAVYVIQEPDVRTDNLQLGGFVVVDIDAFSSISDPKEYDYQNFNPVFLRKKLLVDDANPFDVVMRSVTHAVYPKPICEGDYYIKYLDKNGQYRFMIGEKPSKRTNPRKIGDIDRVLTSLRTDLGNNISVGEKGNNVITVNFNNLRSDLKVMSNGSYIYLDEVALLEDFYNSPDVQLEIQDGKWINVLISGGGTVRQSNKNSYSTSVRLTLPEKYNITKL